MVIFTDGLFPGPGAFVFANSPWPASRGGYQGLRSLERRCQDSPYGFASTTSSHPRCPSPSHRAAPHVSVLSLCPPMGPPGAVPTHEPGEWGSKFDSRDHQRWKRALTFSPVLYQDGPAPLSTGFLRSANERDVFTRWMLCSLTCVLQSKHLVVCGSGRGAGHPRSCSVPKAAARPGEV